MRRFKLTMLVPNSTVIEARDPQDAHNQAKVMINNARVGKGEPKPIMHNIEDLGEIQNDFDYPPPAA